MTRNRWTSLARQGLLAVLVVTFAALLAPTDLIRLRGLALGGFVGAYDYCDGHPTEYSPYTGIEASIIAPTEGTTALPGQQITISVTASDTDKVFKCDYIELIGDGITVSGSGPGSFGSGSGGDVGWTAPTTPGTYTLSITVDDTGGPAAPPAIGTTDDGAVTLSVTIEVDSSPTIYWDQDTPITGGISSPAADEEVPVGYQLSCSATANDNDVRFEDGVPEDRADTCTYTWSADGGSFVNDDNTGADVTWIAPDEPGEYHITVSIDDQNDANKPSSEAGSRNDAAIMATQAVVAWDVVSPPRVPEGQRRTRAIYGASGGQRYIVNEAFQKLQLKATVEAQWSVTLGGGVTPTLVDGVGQPIVNNKASECYIKVDQLPNNNTGFGVKTVTATVNNRSISREVRLFYLPDATPGLFPLTAHPPVTPEGYNATLPNWFYYMTKISNVTEGQTFGFDVGLDAAARTGLTTWIENHVNFPGYTGWMTLLSPRAYKQAGLMHAIEDWGNPSGIDGVAWICRHENAHFDHLIDDWGGDDRNPLDDQDPFQPAPGIPGGLGDWLLDDNEILRLIPNVPNVHGQMALDRLLGRTVEDHWGYGENWCDSEEWAMHTQGRWVNGSAKELDWSLNSWQWTTGL